MVSWTEFHMIWWKHAARIDGKSNFISSFIMRSLSSLLQEHDDFIKWKLFARYWPFVRGIHRSPVNSDHKGQWRGALMFSLICALNKRLSKQSWVCWFETQSRSLCRHWNETIKRIKWATSHMYIYDCEINSPRNWQFPASDWKARVVFHPFFLWNRTVT